jgi:hypothetical protein
MKPSKIESFRLNTIINTHYIPTIRVKSNGIDNHVIDGLVISERNRIAKPSGKVIQLSNTTMNINMDLILLFVNKIIRLYM